MYVCGKAVWGRQSPVILQGEVIIVSQSVKKLRNLIADTQLFAFLPCFSRSLVHLQRIRLCRGSICRQKHQTRY